MLGSGLPACYQYDIHISVLSRVLHAARFFHRQHKIRGSFLFASMWWMSGIQHTGKRFSRKYTEGEKDNEKTTTAAPAQRKHTVSLC